MAGKHVKGEWLIFIFFLFLFSVLLFYLFFLFFRCMSLYKTLQVGKGNRVLVLRVGSLTWSTLNATARTKVNVGFCIDNKNMLNFYVLHTWTTCFFFFFFCEWLIFLIAFYVICFISLIILTCLTHDWTQCF